MRKDSVYLTDKQVRWDKTLHVSLIRLIANPEKYHGKRILVQGYLNLEFEGNAIYLHKEDYDNSLMNNAFWVEFSEDKFDGKSIFEFSKKYVMIIGTFDMNEFGHMGAFSGTIKDITFMKSWNSK